MLNDQFLKEMWLDPAAPAGGYPYDLAIIRALRDRPLSFHPKVTYLVGENGTGKSTVLEALAITLGFNPEGGSRNLRFSTHDTHSDLEQYIHVARGRHTSHGFFFRAESFYNVATAVDEIGVTNWYGGQSLHAQSHGESFLSLARTRFITQGVFLLDEPEAALSPARQLTILSIIHQSVLGGSQFVIATHSPILMAYPDARIYALDETGSHQVAWEDTDQVRISRNFLANPTRMLHYLFTDDDEPP